MTHTDIHAAIEAARSAISLARMVDDIELAEELAQDTLVIAHPHCLSKI
jgi:predicted RNA polymerase sigma factor